MIFLLPILIIIALILNLVVHELGHAIPALIFSRQKTKVFLGSYGDTDNSLKIKLGLLEIYLHPKMLKWQGGICIHDNQLTSSYQDLVITLMGPIIPLFTSIILFWLVFRFQTSDTIRITSIVFVLIAFISFLRSIIPNSNKIRTYDNTITYNDGYLIKLLIKSRKTAHLIQSAQTHLANKEYSNAVTKFEKVVDILENGATLYNAALANYHAKNHVRAEEFINRIKKYQELGFDNLILLSLIQWQQGNIDEAKTTTEKAIEINKNHELAYNNRAFFLILKGNYIEAIIDCNKAITLNPEFSFPYGNRAYANLMLGYLDDVKPDMDKSMAMDPSNSYNYRNQGVYLFMKGEFEEALKQFLNAQEMDPDTYEIKNWIEKAQLAINNLPTPIPNQTNS